jgi:hypothetical protein
MERSAIRGRPSHWRGSGGSDEGGMPPGSAALHPQRAGARSSSTDRQDLPRPQRRAGPGGPRALRRPLRDAQSRATCGCRRRRAGTGAGAHLTGCHAQGWTNAGTAMDSRSVDPAFCTTGRCKVMRTCPDTPEPHRTGSRHLELRPDQQRGPLPQRGLAGDLPPVARRLARPAHSTWTSARSAPRPAP